MLEVNPVLWLAGRDRTKAGLVWTFLGAMAALWAYGLWRHPQAWRDEPAYLFTAVTLHTVFKLWVATEASRRFSADRHSGALELLLATPLSVSQIVTGQLLALWKQFAAPAAVVLLVDIVFLVSGRYQENWVLMCGASLVMFIADLFALSWLGMWTGLRHRSANRAAAAALVRILALPWLVIALLGSVVRLTVKLFPDEPTTILVCLLVKLSFDVYYGQLAAAHLLVNFRKTVTERYEGQAKPHWLAGKFL
jgi:ABC-type transport system involved in cytochrome c biogenesis permease component